ncbi:MULTISPECIES: DUF2058 family protein [unclassified Ectothiorhodospira]|uniref:DUF2058 family protein n=1 Tax=unclassified Ectothiorhodospira TaxID=2684909 RepID=UPI001EE98536|nr:MULTISPECIES: DUF2058 family protein [unclassified Ectothiorhodospira]MCG5515192.1 DUF2058 domain-containing protein [Ectothiorhodospira sp. 9100]MCG5519497.1 DUF2058 domain-containing protein [Ectothiorhodospira sp. 9905]
MSQLRDQLLKAGLVTEEQAKQAEEVQTRPPRAREGRPPRGGGKGRADNRKGGAARARKARPQSDADKPRRAPGRGARPKPAAKPARPDNGQPTPQARALKQELRALIAAQRVNQDQAELPYHFQVGQTIKHLYVTEQQQTQLAEGQLCIAFLDGRRHLLPAAIGRDILARDATRTVVFPGEPEAPGPDPA